MDGCCGDLPCTGPACFNEINDDLENQRQEKQNQRMINAITGRRTSNVSVDVGIIPVIITKTKQNKKKKKNQM